MAPQRSPQNISITGPLSAAPSFIALATTLSTFSVSRYKLVGEAPIVFALREPICGMSGPSIIVVPRRSLGWGAIRGLSFKSFSVQQPIFCQRYQAPADRDLVTCGNNTVSISFSDARCGNEPNGISKWRLPLAASATIEFFENNDENRQGNSIAALGKGTTSAPSPDPLA